MSHSFVPRIIPGASTIVTSAHNVALVLPLSSPDASGASHVTELNFSFKAKGRAVDKGRAEIGDVIIVLRCSKSSLDIMNNIVSS